MVSFVLVMVLSMCTEQECLRAAEAIRVRYVNPLKIETGGCVHDQRDGMVFLTEMECEEDKHEGFECLVC